MVQLNSDDEQVMQILKLVRSVDPYLLIKKISDSYYEDGLYREGFNLLKNNPVYAPPSDFMAYMIFFNEYNVNSIEKYQSLIYDIIRYRLRNTQDTVIKYFHTTSLEVNKDNGRYYKDDGRYYKDDGRYYKDDGRYYKDDGRYYKDDGRYFKDDGRYYKDDGRYYKDNERYYKDNERYYKDDGRYSKYRILKKNNFSETELLEFTYSIFLKGPYDYQALLANLKEYERLDVINLIMRKYCIPDLQKISDDIRKSQSRDKLDIIRRVLSDEKINIKYVCEISEYNPINM